MTKPICISLRQMCHMPPCVAATIVALSDYFLTEWQSDSSNSVRKVVPHMDSAKCPCIRRKDRDSHACINMLDRQVSVKKSASGYITPDGGKVRLAQIPSC